MLDSGTVLVTGGDGYVGSHACKALSRARYLAVTYDSLVYCHEWAVKLGPLEVIRAVERATGLKVLVHHAAWWAWGPAELVSDVPRARGGRGWQPHIARLDDIEHTAWARNRKVPRAPRRLETLFA